MERSITEIEVGWTAYDETGDELGDVADVGENYVLKKGHVFPTDIYIPSSNVDSIDATDATFTVAVFKEDVESLGWHTPPADAPAAESVTALYRPSEAP